MGETTDAAKKAVNTVDLALSAIGLFKSFALVFGVVLIEWARAKQKLAENKTAVAEADLGSKVKQGEIEGAANAKGADKVIDEFLGD